MHTSFKDNCTQCRAIVCLRFSIFLYFSTTAQLLRPRTRMHTAFPELLDSVADRISKQYIHLGLELGFTVERMEQLRMSNRINTLEIIRSMLQEWMEKNKEEARHTIGWLATALLNARCDVTCLVEWQDIIERQQRQEPAPTHRRKCVLQ